MKVVVFGGAGLMGRVAVRDLANQPGLDVTIAEYDVASAERIAAWAGSHVAVTRVDVRDPESADAALRGADCALNAVNYYFNLDVMDACLRMGVPYVDMGGLYHMTRRQLERDAAFRAAGVTAILGVGACPGVTNVHVAYAAKLLDRMTSIRMYDGSAPYESDGVSWGYALGTILDEISMNPVTFRDGTLVELEPVSEVEPYAFSAPIGTRAVHHTLHSEIATMPQVYADRGINEVSFKIDYFGLSAPVFDRLKLLVDLGLADRDPITVGGVEVRPRDILQVALQSRVATTDVPPAETAEELVTEVRGEDAEGPAVITLRTLSRGRADWGIDGSALVTGVPPAIVAGQLASGALKSPGVHAPETILEPQPFFEALAARGIRTTVAVERSVGG